VDSVVAVRSWIVNILTQNALVSNHLLLLSIDPPANGMRIHLHRLSPPDAPQLGLLHEFVTNDDGRLEGGPALKGGIEFTVGTYEWEFYVGDYFASKGTYVSGTPFLDVVPLRFGIDNPDDHYHVPLLVSPWSFSTYRGS
jgi:hydroxyisourate hydrolase